MGSPKKIEDHSKGNVRTLRVSHNLTRGNAQRASRNSLEYGLPCNRERLHNEEQLAVRFEDYPFPEKVADDFLFGYLVADRGQIPAKVIKIVAFNSNVTLSYE